MTALSLLSKTSSGGWRSVQSKLTQADFSPSTQIPDSLLAQITTPGKVATSALDAQIVATDRVNVFTAPQTFTQPVTFGGFGGADKIRIEATSFDETNDEKLLRLMSSTGAEVAYLTALGTLSAKNLLIVDSITLGTGVPIAGDGLTGGTGGAPLSISVADSSGLQLVSQQLDTLLVAHGGLKKSAAGLAVEPTDFAGFGLEDDGSDKLQLASAGIGDGLQGGSGAVLAVDATVARVSSPNTYPAEFAATAGEALTAGQLVRISADGTVMRAKADAPATANPVGVAISDVAVSASGQFLLNGLATFQLELGLTVSAGDELYLSASIPGYATNVAPSDASQLVVPVGRIVDASGYVGSAQENSLVSGILRIDRALERN